MAKPTASPAEAASAAGPRAGVLSVVRQENIAAAFHWVSNRTLASIIMALALNAPAEVDPDDWKTIHSGLLQQAEDRGWPDGWWEDLSVVPGVEEAP